MATVKLLVGTDVAFHVRHYSDSDVVAVDALCASCSPELKRLAGTRIKSLDTYWARRNKPIDGDDWKGPSLLGVRRRGGWWRAGHCQCDGSGILLKRRRNACIQTSLRLWGARLKDAVHVSGAFSPLSTFLEAPGNRFSTSLSQMGAPRPKALLRKIFGGTCRSSCFVHIILHYRRWWLHHQTRTFDEGSKFLSWRELVFRNGGKLPQAENVLWSHA